MARVLSGIQPSGALHIGNYFGAVRQWVAAQDSADAFYLIVDLHALTVEVRPEVLRTRTLDTAISLLAAGLDPRRCTLFVQGHVPEHNQMAWIMECLATFGELARMTQFKEKAGGHESVRAGLFTYPALMAADVLLYQADRVPVGDDQRQHLELTRDLALRFNGRYREVFVVPEVVVPPVGARVMDLQEPTRKMSKSITSPQGTVDLTDSPDEIRRKVRRAVTDAGTDVVFDREARPGVANLLELLGATTGRAPEVLAAEFSSYGVLKATVADALVEALAPVQARMAELRTDLAYVEESLRHGAEKAQSIASKTLAEARDAVGLLPLP